MSSLWEKQLIFTRFASGIFCVLGLLLLSDVATPAEPAPNAASSSSEAENSVTIGERTYLFLGDCQSAQYNISLTLQPKQADGFLPQFTLLFCYRDPLNHYRLDWTHGQGSPARPALTLYAVEGGKTRSLGTCNLPSLEPGKELLIGIRRRSWTLEVTLDDEAIIGALDLSYDVGRVALWASAPGLRIGGYRVQPVTAIHLQEDFTRAGEDIGQWHPVRGEWRLYTVRESELVHPERRGRQLEAARSANYFSLTGASDDWALCVAGDSHPFWDRYHFGANVCGGGEPFGLVFYLKDDRNFLLLRWNLRSILPEPQALELVRVIEGREKVLSRVAVPGAAGQWHRLELAAEGRRVRAWVDRAPVLDVYADGPTEGRVGLYMEGKVKTLFDDVWVRSVTTYTFDTIARLGIEQGKTSNGWIAEPMPGIGAAREATRARLVQTGPSEAFHWLGDARQGQYRLSAQARIGAVEGWIGLAAKRDEERGTLLFRCGGGPTSRAQLLTITKAGESILAEAALPTISQGFHELALDLIEPGWVKGYFDHELLLRAPDPAPGPSQPGVYSNKGAGTVFEDVRAATQREVEDVSKVVATKLFATDRYMANWASEPHAWVTAPSGKIRWHSSDFYGPFELSFPIWEGMSAYICARDGDEKSGYELHIAKTDEGNALLLKRLGQEIRRVILPQNEGRLSLNREGAHLWVRLGEKELLSYHDPEPLRGSRLALCLNGMDIELVRVVQFNVSDYLFEEAPSDWRRIGTWEVTNRFTCDPRWSWFAGTCWEGLGAIWNKFAYQGDVTVEFFAGMRMAGGGRPIYPRPGELNATICGNGRDTSSGYSVIISGWDPLWTGKWSRIFRQEQQVAFTTRELVPSNREENPTRRPIVLEWDPGGRPIHGAWYYIKVRRLGSRIEAYFDNELVMQYDDPHPLNGDRVAIWTMDNSIMVARVRISYQRKLVPQLPVKPLPLEEPSPPAVKPAPPSPLISSPSHPGFFSDFEHHAVGWESLNAEQGALLSLDTSTAGSGRSSLRLKNFNCGGTFGARVTIPDLDLLRVADFRFKYRIPPEVKVNFYFTISNRDYFIRFTGPDQSGERLRCLGEIPNVRADDQWHEASFNVAAALRRLFPHLSRATCHELRIGNFHEGYLRAGIGGNHEGATGYLDDFQVASVGPSRVDIIWTGDLANYAYSVTPNAPAEPDDNLKGNAPRRTITAEGPGLWYFNLKGMNEEGLWTAAVHLPFWVDTSPVQLCEISPPDKAMWGGGEVRLRFLPSPGATLNVPAARLKVNGIAIPFDPAIFRYDPLGHALHLNLAATYRDAAEVVSAASATLGPFTDGETVHFNLELGKWLSPIFESPASAQEFSWSYTFSRAADKEPPSLVRLSRYPLKQDFEEGHGGIVSPTETIWIIRDQTEASSGRYCLKVVGPTLGNEMRVQLIGQPFHAGKCPILAFDYRTEKVVHFDLFLTTGIGIRTIAFTDGQMTRYQLTSVPGVIPDDRWRHAEINLRQAIETQPYQRGMYDVTNLYTADGGYRACAPGSTFRVDNLELVPALSSRQRLTLSWTARDLSGIDGYSFHWSPKPSDDPDEESEGPESSRTFTNLPEGVQWFHIRARDKAGNWGPTSHYRFLIDNTPPKLAMLLTKSEAQATALIPASEDLAMTIADEGGSGVDRSTFAFQIQNATLRPSELLSTYHFATGGFKWNWVLEQGGARPPVADGSEFLVRAEPISDFAGNQSPPIVWTMRVEHEKDKLPPTPPEVTSLTGEILAHDVFARSLGEWSPYPSRDQAVLSLTQRSARDNCLQVQGPYGGVFGARFSARGYDLEQYPFIRFDYRFPPGSHLQLVVNVNDREYGVMLTSRAARAVHVGQIQSIRADGTWRTATFNLFSALRPHTQGQKSLIVKWLFIGDMNGQNPAGMMFSLDNFMVYGLATKPPVLQLLSYDLTGIRGFGYVVDQTPDTQPTFDAPTELPRTEKGWTLSLGELLTGENFLHVRACDGAGNWGPTTHVPFSVPQQGL